MCMLMTEHGSVLVETLGVLVIFGRDIKIYPGSVLKRCIRGKL